MNQSYVNTTTENTRIQRTRALISPAVLAEDIPLTAEVAHQITQARESIAACIRGTDTRPLIIVGPCSVHDLDAARAYAERLAPVAESMRAELNIVMRVYFEKPRTTVGWKGYINDPNLDESFAVNQGLRGARQLLAELTGMGLATATEFLDTTFGQYYSEFIAWAAIGARTVESQVHRQLASGLSMPVGIKNGTTGNLDVAADAIVAASHSHLFPSLSKEGAPVLLETAGNPDCHLVMRGGGGKTNYAEEDISTAVELLEARGISNGIMVDCSHGNSQKDHRRQAEVARNVLQQRQQNGRIVGLMLESHLEPGRQDKPEKFGCSITDACMGWSETEQLLQELAAL